MAARKTSTAPTRIWTCAAKLTSWDGPREILWRSHRYYNALVEIERIAPRSIHRDSARPRPRAGGARGAVGRARRRDPRHRVED